MKTRDKQSIFNISLTELMILIVFLLLFISILSINSLNSTEMELNKIKNVFKQISKTDKNIKINKLPEKWEKLTIAEKQLEKSIEKTIKQAILINELVSKKKDNENKIERLKELIEIRFGNKKNSQIALEEIKEKLASANRKIKKLDRELAIMKAKYKGGGVGKCWKKGKNSEKLLDIYVYNDYFIVFPKWPEHRNEEASTIPGLKELIKRRQIDNKSFLIITKKILEYGLDKSPPCRYVAHVYDKTSNNKKFIKDQEDILRARLWHKLID